jgi:putative membrane protein
MTSTTSTLGRIARRTPALAVTLLVAATGTAAAHGGYGGGMMSGGTMGSGGWGLFGVLWMLLLLAVPAYLVYVLVTRGADGRGDRPLAILRERYARGELTDEEFEQRRARLR